MKNIQKRGFITMKKKVLSAMLSAAILVGVSAAAFASKADATPDVFINNTQVYFEDQKPVIKDDFTLIPVRGVLEAMNDTVEWDGENRTVTVKSENNLTRVVLTIDSNIMNVYHFTSIMSADKTEVELEVAPQIINDRTMVPFRAVCEAMGAKVDWNDDDYAVLISTLDNAQAPAEVTDKLVASASASSNEVKVGDEVTVFMNIKNLTSLYPDRFVSGITAGLNYDKKLFKLTDSYLCTKDGKQLASSDGLSNDEYTEEGLKAVYITINGDEAAKEDGAVLALVFTAQAEGTGSFTLADRYHSRLGHDLTVLLSDMDNKNTSLLKGDDVVIDTTAVEVKVTAADNTKADDTKADDTAADDTKVDDTKADDTKADDTKTDDTKADDTKTDDTKADDNTETAE